MYICNLIIGIGGKVNMSIDVEKLNKLNKLVSLFFRRKHIIVLNPKDKQKNEIDPNANITYDKSEWKIPDKLNYLVNELSESSYLNNEDKILMIFEKICKGYIYDDNLISYIQKVDDDSYDLPDWYGREIDEKWEKNREEHNRRVCYEVSRYLAEGLNELFKDNDDFNVCILWDKGHTHYFVGLTCNDYSITLDTDDFDNIKDLTRLKTGLTAQGIVILDDKENKFKNALDKFNKNKNPDSIKKIEQDIATNTTSSNINIDNQSSISTDENDDIAFIRNAIEILKDKYKIDSQGLFEYIKEIVDIKLGPEKRKKVWKKIEGKDGKATRYVRCLVLDMDDQKYIIDVEESILRTFNEEEFKSEDAVFIPYKELSRDDDELYDGT